MNLWRYEGRRARDRDPMMTPGYTNWHGMYEVVECFYMELISQARKLISGRRVHDGKDSAATNLVSAVVEGTLARPAHARFEGGAEEQTRLISEATEDRYGQ